MADDNNPFGQGQAGIWPTAALGRLGVDRACRHKMHVSDRFGSWWTDPLHINVQYLHARPHTPQWSFVMLLEEC